MGKICPAKGLGGRQLSPGRCLDQWEFCLGQLIPHFSAFYIRRVEEPGRHPGAVAGAEEKAQSSQGLAAKSAGPEGFSLSLEQLPSQTADRAG